MNDRRLTLADNLKRVQDRIAGAAQRGGRHPADVTLVAVTKYVEADLCRLLLESGIQDLGESRPQQLWQKAELLGDLPVRWHMIGHLQRNKVARSVPHIHLLHSGDSVRLLKAVSDEATKPLEVLLEVNVSGDQNKHGFSADSLRDRFPALLQLESIQIIGLMAMAGIDSDAAEARRQFSRLRDLRDELQEVFENPLPHLSMGMSSDFEAAIEEGATYVRVGSALFTGISND